MSTKLALAVGETCFWGLQPKDGWCGGGVNVPQRNVVLFS